MKGHVGGGSGSNVFKALVIRLKLSRSHMSFTYPYVMDVSFGFLLGGASERYCAERLLEMRGLIVEFHCDLIGHKLESLIMAQNERWRHA